MNEIQRYLAEEIALDHKDGLLERREALRRLGLMGISGAAALALLAACRGSRTSAASSSASASVSASPLGAASRSTPPDTGIATEAVRFAGPEGRSLMGAWAAATKPRAGVLVIHENKGLTDHIRSVAGRLAVAGYSALAIDLLSDRGGTAALGDPANATAALGKVAPERFVADLRAGLDELARRVPGAKLGVVGFCFGGAMTWRLLASKEPRLAAAAPFYGPMPEGADFAGVKAAVLAIYAERDERVNATREAAQAALTRGGVTHEVITYPGAEHAFLNDSGPRYNAAAAAQAWQKLLDWFGTHL